MRGSAGPSACECFDSGIYIDIPIGLFPEAMRGRTVTAIARVRGEWSGLISIGGSTVKHGLARAGTWIHAGRALR